MLLYHLVMGFFICLIVCQSGLRHPQELRRNQKLYKYRKHRHCIMHMDLKLHHSLRIKGVSE